MSAMHGRVTVNRPGLRAGSRIVIDPAKHADAIAAGWIVVEEPETIPEPEPVEPEPVEPEPVEPEPEVEVEPEVPDADTDQGWAGVL
jgi:hypothetical protein